MHDDTPRASAARGIQFAFSDSDEEEETLNENDEATNATISKLIALQNDARLQQERARWESEQIIEDTHYVWEPPFAQGCLWVALPKSGQGKDFFRVGYNFDFLLVRKTRFYQKIQSLPHIVAIGRAARAAPAAAGAGRRPARALAASPRAACVGMCLPCFRICRAGSPGPWGARRRSGRPRAALAAVRISVPRDTDARTRAQSPRTN